MGASVSPYDYINASCDVAFSIASQFPPMYFMECGNCNKYNEFASSFFPACHQAGLFPYDLSMLYPCFNFYSNQGIQYLCQNNVSDLFNYINSTSQMAVQLNYITIQEHNLCMDFLQDIQQNNYNVNVCSYVTLWNSISKSNLTNGLLSAILLCAGCAGYQSVVDNSNGNYPQGNQGIIKFLKMAGGACVAAMISVFEKGDKGLQDGCAGKMILSDGGKGGAGAAID